MIKKLSFALLFLLLLLYPAYSESAPQVLLRTEAFDIVLLGAYTAPGVVDIEIKCANRNGEEHTVIAFDPEYNDNIASFAHGWGSEIIEIPAGEDKTQTFTVESDDAEEILDQLALRWISEGTVSSRTVIDVTQFDVPAISCATLEGGKSEPPLVTRQVAAPEDPAQYARTYQDELSDEERAMLDYGDLAVFKVEEREDGLLLTQLASVEIDIADDGTATAQFSGLAVTLKDDRSFIVQTSETAHKDGINISASMATKPVFSSGWDTSEKPLALSGDAVYFASLAFDVVSLEEGYITTDIRIDSPEIEQTCHNMPCSLFDSAQASCDQWTATEDVDELCVKRSDGYSARFSIQRPLEFSLVPVSMLGDIVVCFEYFFVDGSDVMRLPIPY